LLHRIGHKNEKTKTHLLKTRTSQHQNIAASTSPKDPCGKRKNKKVLQTCPLYANEIGEHNGRNAHENFPSRGCEAGLSFPEK